MSIAASVDGVNSILVIGDARVGKRFLVRRLIGGGEAQAEAEAEAAAPAPAAVLPHSRIETYHRAVDTKYYSATLAFHVLPAAAHAALSGDEHDDTDTAGALSAAAHDEFGALAPQALVLVFDVHVPSSFHAVAARWEAFIREHDPPVMLCVGNQSSGTAGEAEAQRREREELEQLARDWALDHGLEYVSLPYNDAAPSSHTALGVASSSGAAGDLDASGEPVGVARVLEALECNMWEHIALKDRRTLQYMQGKDRDQDADEEGKDAADVDGDESQSAFAAMHEEKQRDDAKEATARPVEEAQGEEDTFSQFVSAFPFVSASTADAAAAAVAPHVTASVPISTSAAAVTAASTKPATAAASAARSASASAFASGFMRAISTDSPAKPTTQKTGAAAAPAAPTAAAAVVPAPPAAAPSTAADAVASLDAPLDPAEMDALSAQLLAAQSAAEASHRAADTSVAADGDAADRDLENEMVAFDAVFEKLGSIKAEAARARDGQSGLTDAERRRRAEQAVMQLLKSMGMEDELDGSDDEDEAAAADKAT